LSRYFRKIPVERDYAEGVRTGVVFVGKIPDQKNPTFGIGRLQRGAGHLAVWAFD
jgi:hypothetical protein